MRPLRGGPRLDAVARLVPPGSLVADIGTDHGRLPRVLLATGRARRCIATERDGRRPALMRVRDEPLGERVELRFGDGLAALAPDDGVEVLVLAGMGGRTIRSILERGRLERLALRRLVLQPQSDAALLRGWLVERGWEIIDELLVRERKRWYLALAAEPAPDGSEPAIPDGLQPEDLFAVGPCLVRSEDPAVRELWEARARTLTEALDRAGQPEALAEIRAELEQARRIVAALPGP